MPRLLPLCQSAQFNNLATEPDVLPIQETKTQHNKLTQKLDNTKNNIS